MSEDRRPQGTVQIALRISPDLRERVKAAAEANNRSVNSELTAALEERYPAPEPVDLSTAEGLEALVGMSHEELLERADEINAEAQRVLPSEHPFLVRYEHEGRPYAYLNRATLEALVEAQVAALRTKIESKTSPSRDAP